MAEVVVFRHGETDWSRTHRHTGRTDVPLTQEGKLDAERLRPVIADRSFARVFSSPLARARETAALAGAAAPEIRDELREWDYGDYEGLTTTEIRESRPGWTVWSDDCPNGETVGELGRRVDRVIAELRDAPGDVAVFAHGHLGRVLAVRWLELAPDSGRHLLFATGRYGVLGWERETPALVGWNLAP